MTYTGAIADYKRTVSSILQLINIQIYQRGVGVMERVNGKVHECEYHNHI